MISFFRKIRQELLLQNRVTQYLAYAGDEIFLVVIKNDSPFRDLIWVERKNFKAATVPLGTGYVGNSTIGTFHIAYLRHAIPDYKSVFYRYFVPTGQLPQKH